jgi:lysophospholipid acyltransferase (LPLAT)-like uncharacterized protein
LKIRSPLLTKMAIALFTRLVRLLFCTVRCDFRTQTAGTNPYIVSGPERFLYCVWHDSMIVPMFAGRHTSSAALVSRHQDGSYIAGILRMVGMSSVRGSTKHGGASALRQMMTTAKDKHIVITPDGPRGPRRRMHSGIVFLASHTGRAIVPTAYACLRSWKIKGSWTDLTMPKPFTKIFLMAGAPIRVPAELSREEFARYIALVQDEMDRLNLEVERLVALSRKERAEDETRQRANRAARVDGHATVAAG